jgi:predicted Zn-dependent protease
MSPRTEIPGDVRPDTSCRKNRFSGPAVLAFCRQVCIHVSAIGLIAVSNLASPVVAQPPNMPQFEQFFDQLTGNANRFAPGMFGELSADQIERLKTVTISVIEEKKYGQQVLDSYLEQAEARRLKVSRVGAESQYLAKLAATVKPLMQNARRYRTIDIYITNSETPDAYSIPGGFLIFSTGLLESAETEAALVGVIGHELSHLDHGHQTLTLKQSKLMKQPLDFRDNMLGVTLMARPFRPEQETEADADAIKWMMQLGYSANELARLMQRWAERQDQVQPWMSFVPSFVKSHPDPNRRALKMAELASLLRPTYPNAKYVGRTNLERQIPRSKQEFAK